MNPYDESNAIYIFTVVAIIQGYGLKFLSRKPRGNRSVKVNQHV